MHRETADDYGRVVARINASQRIIRCGHDLQFIAQTRKRGGRRPWRAFSYFATVEGAKRLPAPFHAPAVALFAKVKESA